VRLTAAGTALLLETRQILAHVDRAAMAAQRAARSAPTLRVGTVDASYDSLPAIVRRLQARFPDLEIHQVEAGVPEQYLLLAGGRLDVGIGRASLAPPEVASELFRLDPLGVLICEGHRFASLPGVPVAVLAEEPLLLAEEARAPEFNQFVMELCRSVGFLPAVYRGTVESIRAAVDLVAQGRTVLCAPASCVPAHPGVVWRPLTEPVSLYPWSVLWRAEDHSKQVRAMVSCARELSRELGWLETSSQAAG
jgi:DNA-binding transcriptional LysR family regulator